MKKAVIDIGSNSLKFLLADLRAGEEPKILADKSVTTRLAEGTEATGSLPQKSIDETIKLCGEYIEKARHQAAKRILVFATSAVREAKNRGDFEKAFKSRTDMDLIVLSEKQEAALVFAGAASDPQFPQGEAIVMDVGGGSAEWILGSNGKILSQHSAPLGCVRMTEKFLRGDPYSEESFQQLIRHLESSMQGLKAEFMLEERPFVGTGGTACALAAFDCEIEKKGQPVHRHILEIDRIDTFVTHLRSLPQKERQKLPGIPSSRADVVTAGSAAFAVAMHVLGAEAMQVSVRGLRYGALFA